MSYRYLPVHVIPGAWHQIDSTVNSVAHALCAHSTPLPSCRRTATPFYHIVQINHRLCTRKHSIPNFMAHGMHAVCTQAGAALSYNAVLAGPQAGPPVWLDTGGLPLASAAQGVAGASTTAALAPTLQLAWLRVLGPPSPLLTVSSEALTGGVNNGNIFSDADGEAAGTGVRLAAWRDRYVTQLQEGCRCCGTAMNSKQHCCVLWHMRCRCRCLTTPRTYPVRIAVHQSVIFVTAGARAPAFECLPKARGAGRNVQHSAPDIVCA